MHQESEWRPDCNNLIEKPLPKKKFLNKQAYWKILKARLKILVVAQKTNPRYCAEFAVYELESQPDGCDPTSSF